MAHNIALDSKTQEHAFFSRKEIPWHRLGQVVEKALTSEEAIKAAHLDYQVEQFPLLAKISDEVQPPVPGKFATVRTDTNQVLGVVGSRYEIVQNSQAFDFVDEIVGSKEAVFETAGALGNGEKIFVTAKLPTNIRIAKTDDIIEEYILFTSAHDGSGAVYAGFTPIRVVCNNTLNMALRSVRNKLTLRHTRSVHDNLKMGLQLMGLQRAYSLEFKQNLEALAKKKINDDKIKEIVNSLVLKPEELLEVKKGLPYEDFLSTRKINLLTEMTDYIDKGVGQELHKGTALWLFNGVSSYYSNGKQYSSDEDRMNKITEGRSYRKTQKAFNLLLAS